MKRAAFLLLLICASVAAAPEDCRRGAEVALAPVCGSPSPGLRIACSAPADVVPPANTALQQRAFDVFAWQQFIALNWPAGSGAGTPAVAKPISATGPRVWETWKEAEEVYLPDGRKPAPWESATGRGLLKHLFRTQKVDDVLDANIQPTGADGTLPVTLTDQRGRVVYYEIRMNRVAFDYVVTQRLYDTRVQRRAASVTFPEGAILIKAAWRQLEPQDEERYLTTNAQLCDKAGRCAQRSVGLVGFHVMIKTKRAPQWIWATFEHGDNVSGVNPTFFNPLCRDCAAVENRQTLPGVPNQVVRMVAISARDPVCSVPAPTPDGATDNVVALNAEVDAALAQAGSVLARYQLIATQRPTIADTPNTVFAVTPALLGNTTMETFIQRTSSCMGCHAMARSARADHFVSSDFTFTLNDAGPALPPLPKFLPLHPAAAITQRAVAIAQHTYEMVPAPHVVARLHCGSCHLDAGTNERAAWWAGSADRFPGRDQLFHRINQCFRNSMNGAAVCGSDTECASNADMMALVTYVEDLTAAWHKLHGKQTAPGGFPAIAAKTPDTHNGAAIYQQKCAFCHGANGEGRYGSGTYYRPALWGQDSFDAQAGMAEPGTFAAFVRANMPLGSGGELTEQEAWDIAGFVDTQCRPKKPGCKP